MAEPEMVLVLGATSAIAQAVCRQWATVGASFALVGRDAARLAIVRDDLIARGARSAHTQVLDFSDFAAYDTTVDEAKEVLGGLTTVLVAHGELTDQSRAEAETDYLVRQLNINLLSPLVALSVAANRLEATGQGGTIIVLGSVAGDRGRRTNYVYGTAKAALATFAEGMRSRLATSGVTVLVVKPGRVDTPMTAHLPKSALYASPERVARDVLAAAHSRRDVVYAPFYWRYVMLVIRNLPGRLFKKARF